MTSEFSWQNSVSLFFFSFSFFFLIVYLFIPGCVGSLLLRRPSLVVESAGYSAVAARGLLLEAGLSCCRART